MGPDPPIAASQTMISFSSSPSAVDEVNKSYATSATTSVPAYFQAQAEVIEVIADNCLAAAVTTTFGYDLTEVAAPAQDHLCDDCQSHADLAWKLEAYDDDHANLVPLILSTLKHPLPDVAESSPHRLLYTVYEPVTTLSWF